MERFHIGLKGENAMPNGLGTGMGSGMGGGRDYSKTDYGQLFGGLAGMLGGIFGGGGSAYDKEKEELEKYLGKATGALDPWAQAGQGALGDYQKWLAGMQDPSGYVNQLMGKYQESPEATYLKNQAMSAGTNAASASGLAGSTPFAKQMAQTAEGISQNDLQKWLGNVFGVNKMYGQGVGNLMGQGFNAASQQAGMYGKFAPGIAGAAYGSERGNQMDWGNFLGGMANTAASLPWETML